MKAKKLNHRQECWSLLLACFDFIMHHWLGRSMGRSDALLCQVDHGSGANDNENIVLLTLDLFVIWALEGLELIGEEKEILREIKREMENAEREEAVAKAVKSFGKPPHIPSNHHNGHNLKVFYIFVAKFMFQTWQISDSRSSLFVMIPRLQDIVAGGKHGSWSLIIIGGPKCPDGQRRRVGSGRDFGQWSNQLEIAVPGQMGGF